LNPKAAKLTRAILDRKKAGVVGSSTTFHRG